MNDRTLSYRIFTIINYIFLGTLGIICLLPIIHIFAVSLSNAASVNGNLVTFLPIGFNIENYKATFTNLSFFRAFFVSIKRVIIGTLVNMFFITVTAYPLSYEPEDFKGRNTIMWFFIIPMLFSGGLIPTYLVIRNLGLLNKFWVMILPGAVSIWNIIMMMNFFRGIPKSLSEAARIDGASQWSIFSKIYIPLSKASLATLSLFCIVGHWNAWFDALIYINNSDGWPLQTFLQSLLMQTQTVLNRAILTPQQIASLSKLSNQSLIASQIFITTFPILCVYPFLQKYFVKGMVAGSVKE